MDMKVLSQIGPWDWPDDAGATILQTLTDARAKLVDRLLAAELAGDLAVVNDDLAGALLEIACRSDAPEELRGIAAIALGPSLEDEDVRGPDGDFDEAVLSAGMIERIRSSLRRLYSDEDAPRDVRRRALEASVRAPEEWHREAVVEAIESGDAAWRATAVFCMSHIRGFEPQILEALDDDDPEIQYEAVCAAGHLALDAAWEHVVDLLDEESTDKPLLLAAIEAAVTIRPAEAPDVVADLLESEDEDIVEAAFEAITIAEPELEEDGEEDSW
jgi:hypothetical protein